MTQSFDVVIIGTGSAATVVAGKLRAAGRSVAVVDWRPYGGTCVLRGCDPKKMLLGGAAAVDHVRRMLGHGVTGDSGIAWAELMRFKRGFTDPVPAAREKRFAEQGITRLHGHARFTGPNTLAIDGEIVHARNVVIAAGAEPARLGIPGEEHLVDNEGFLALETLPPRLVLVGGGYVAAEFSQVASRAGAAVSILQHGERMLKGFDADLVGWLMKSFDDAGIDVRLRSTVQAIEKHGDTYKVQVSCDGHPFTLDADLVVHAAGRAPALEDLDLAAARVTTERGRLLLNEYLQSTSNPAVYAAGDAAQVGPPLTPVSSHDGKVVAANLLEGNHRKPDYRGVPSVAFTLPPIARVGLGEEEAREQGLRFDLNTQEASDWFTARQASQPVYGHKVLVEKDSGRILGAHLVGPHADEVINLFALAIRHGLTARDLKDTMFAYPTAASDVGYML